MIRYKYRFSTGRSKYKLFIWKNYAYDTEHLKKINFIKEPVEKDELVKMEDYADLPEEDYEEEYLNIPHVKVRKVTPKFKEYSRKSNGWKTKTHARKSWGGDARTVLKNQYNISEFYYE